MSFTGGHPTIRWGVDETVWIRVEVEDPAAMDADSPEAAACTIVASALFDLELTTDDATILHDQTRIA